MDRSITQRFFRWSFALSCFTILFVAAEGCAQTINVGNIDIVNTPVPGSGHDYIKMLNETINPASGSLSLRIEAPVPKQRGDVNNPFYVFGYDSGGVMQPSAWISWANVNGFALAGLNINWTNSAVVTGNGSPILGMVPGGFVANAGISQTFQAYSSLITVVNTNPQLTATCDFYSGYVYIDPFATRHAMNVGWITQNGGSGGDEGCSWYGSATVFNTSWGDAQYGMTLKGTQNNPSFGAYVTDNHGRSPVGVSYINGFLTAGMEDTNGNTPFVKPTPTVVNNQVTSVSIPGLANPYSYSYSTTTINYMPGSTLLAQDSGGNCPTSISGPIQGGNTPTVVKTITLPNSTTTIPQQYVFGYDSKYGLLNSITYPTGATVSYNWGVNPQSESIALGSAGSGTPFCWYTHDWPAVQSRIVSFDGTTAALEQDFSYAPTTWGTGTGSNKWTKKVTTVTTKDCTRASNCSAAPKFKTIYTYFPMDASFAMGAGQTAVENKIAYYDWNGSLLKTVTKNWTPGLPPQLASQCVTLPNGQTAGTFYAYAAFDVVKDKKEYDYGSISSAACAQGASPPTSTPARETIITYQAFPATPLFPTPSISDRPSTIKVYGNGTLLAETDYVYDAYSNGITSVTAVGHDDTNFPTSYTNRGNVTSRTVKCLQTSCVNAVTTYTGYDLTGQVLSSVDPNGNASGGNASAHTTYYSYTDSFVSGDTYTSQVMPPSKQTNAYLTTITFPPTNGASHVESFSYDYPSGQLTVSRDENKQPTTYRYDDYFARLTETAYPDGGQTTIAYNDAPYSATYNTPSVTTTGAISSTTNKVVTAAYDGVGHTVQAILSSDPSGPTYTAVSYDGTGRPYRVYNPTRCSPPTTNCGEGTWGVTTYVYDALGRTTTMTRPDGTSASTTYSGRAAQVSDEGNGTHSVQRISQTDALGRLVSVCEVTSATQSGGGAPGVCGQDIAGTGFITNYQYDALDNLIGVQQGSRSRSFSYDSLSRLLCAANPETSGGASCPYPDNGGYTPGTTRYGYDANGNLAQRIRPAPNQTNPATTVTTAYGYDVLNRLTSTSYSDGVTPKVTRHYDTTLELGRGLNNTIGRLSAEYVTSPSGALLSGKLFGYDPMGRVNDNSQCTPNSGCSSTTAAAITYAYDLLGDISAAVSGEGITFNYGYNNAARLTSLTSSLVDSNHPSTLLSGATYSALGAPTGASLGNALNEARVYDCRGRVLAYASVVYPTVPSLSGIANTPGCANTTAFNWGIRGPNLLAFQAGILAREFPLVPREPNLFKPADPVSWVNPFAVLTEGQR